MVKRERFDTLDKMDDMNFVLLLLLKGNKYINSYNNHQQNNYKNQQFNHQKTLPQ